MDGGIATEAPKLDAFDLYRALNNFFGCQQHSGSVEYRWLADQAIPLKNLAYDLHANGVVSFREKNGAEIAAFRLLEIEEERAKLAKSDGRLADEAKQLAKISSQ